jgi:ferritin-like metal-binding protein YciE
MTMNTEELKKNFDDQLAQTEKQINELEANLAKAREYRTKLQGGLETLSLLEPKDEIEESINGNQIIDGVEHVKPMIDGEPSCPEDEQEPPHSVAHL